MKKLALLIAILFYSCSSILNLKVKEEIFTATTTNKKQSEVIIENVVGTVYHLESSQCDSNPYETADGTNLKGKDINKLRYVALSRDLINDEYRDKLHNVKGQWKGKIKFGDTITIVSDNKLLCGKWIVKDCMNKRFKKKVDFMQDKASGFYGKWNDLKIIVNV